MSAACRPRPNGNMRVECRLRRLIGPREAKNQVMMLPKFITTAVLSGMQENPAEWCLDLLKLESNPLVDPLGRIEGPYHSLRGVRGKMPEASCGARHVGYSTRGIRDVGFRPVLAPDLSRLAPVNR